MNPKITVVTPSFNQGQFLEQTIKSVVDQDYPNLDYIVIDGGSKDDSVDIIRKYSDKLAYWISEPDLGHGHALNKGFERSSGEIMAWLNSDDLYVPWTLRTVAEIFAQRPEVEWITGINTHWDEQGRITNAFHTYKNIYDFLIGRYDWIQQESTFWRRSLWERSGGFINEFYSLMVDGELWSRFFLSAELYHAKCVLGGFRMWGGNRSAQKMDICHAEMRSCTKVLSDSCDKEVRARANMLAMFLKAEKITKGFPAKALIRRTLPSLAKQAGYKSLYYQSGVWEIENLPY